MQPKPLSATWAEILERWLQVELDLQDWGIDLESDVLDHRTWRWLAARVVGLISTPTSRLHRALTSKKEPPHGAS